MSTTRNAGIRWNIKEDEILLDQIKNNIDINIISSNHKRTVVSILARINKLIPNILDEQFQNNCIKYITDNKDLYLKNKINFSNIKDTEDKVLIPTILKYR